jgi:hypothetical protein
MNSVLCKLIVSFFLLLQVPSFAATDAEVCKALAGVDLAGATKSFTSPAREPTKAEMTLIEGANIELLEATMYSKGISIVDADNDGIDDYFAWNVDGSGRYGTAEIYSKSFLNKWGQGVGILHDPRFVRYAKTNYLVITEDGSYEGLSVRQIEKSKSGELMTRRVCQTKVALVTASQCRHSACKSLIREINNPETNQPYINIEWPHKYFTQAGLQVFFPSEPIEIDFDNTKQPTKIWKFGREDYSYQYIYWSLLGVGESEPSFQSSLRNKDEGAYRRSVLPSKAHDRLRRLMTQHSAVLSSELGKKVSLPTDGDFFHININDRVYWVWELGGQPWGDNMHILYTRGNKSDYIGKVSIKRKVELRPCEADCIVTD